MVDFTSLYRKPAGEAKKAPRMPAGDWPVMIRGFEKTISAQKKTPGYKYFLQLTDFPADMPESWTETDAAGTTYEYTKEDFNLGRQQEYTFWFWPDSSNPEEIAEPAIFQFDQFLRSLNIEPQGRSYEELESEPIGHAAILVMRETLDEKTNRLFVNAQRLMGTGE